MPYMEESVSAAKMVEVELMKEKSILLAISGSEQSRHASEVCWKLARRLGTAITAHHVVDSFRAWEFLGHENPGFLEPGAYLEPYQELVSALFVLGKELAASYAREAQAAGIDNVCLIDVGNPVTEICRRSANHKMVVIGHRTPGQMHACSQIQRLTVAEALAHDCPRPLLIVQNKCRSWSSFLAVLSVDRINETFVSSCLEMAQALDLSPSILCLTGGASVEDCQDRIRDMRKRIRQLQEIPMSLAETGGEMPANLEDWRDPGGKPFGENYFENTLIVIPTRMVAGQRLTVAGSSPSLVVRHLKNPSILLWPEEFAFAGMLVEAGAVRKLATPV
jgi:nucleotide-binding universal stress UspA family protein